MSSRSPFEQASAPLTAVPGQRPSRLAVPVPVTSILGRDAEIARLVAMLDADDTRLVTLSGPGGIGKTRLALEVARRIEGDFAHGACLVALASVRDPELVPSAAALALGLQESGDRPAATLVLSALRDRHLLLVLDNLEHLVDGVAPWLGELLGACARVTVLATSRIALQIAGERRFVVEPLPLPEAASDGDIDRILEGTAVELFVQRAVAVRPAFALTPRNVEAVRGICRALDGLPLAIELAAARVRVLSPAELLVRMTDRLNLLRSERRDAPKRHRTMRDALDWSHDLLTTDQQRLFRWLSVFTGGFSLDAAEAVGAVEGSSRPVLDLVMDLIDHSLIRQAPVEEDGARFGMHELIREYGLDHLERAGETADARDAHAIWCRDLGVRAGKGIEGQEQVASLALLDAELDNIRAALAWLVERERIEVAQELGGAIWFYLWLRGHFAEGRKLYEDLLAHPGNNGQTVARAGVLTGAGTLAAVQGDVARSLETIEEAIAILRRLDVPGILAWTQMCHCYAFQFGGRLDEADAACTESLALGRALGDAWVIAANLNLLGLAASEGGERDLACSYWQECADVSRASGNRWGLSLGLGNLAFSSIRAGDATRAVAYLEECEALMREVGDLTNLPVHLMALSDVARMQGDDAVALSYLHEALGEAGRIGDHYGTGYALVGLGRTALSSGEVEHAARLFRGAIESFRQRGTAYDLAHCLDALADVAFAVNEMSRAARLVGGSDAALERAGYARVEDAPGEHEQRVAAIVAALGEEDYRQAWEGGHARSMDDAIAEALAYQPSPIGPAAPALADKTVPPGPADGLTPRELEVLRLMAQGLTNQEVADALYLSRRTATSHASAILGKLGLTTRTAAVAWAIRNGLA